MREITRSKTETGSLGRIRAGRPSLQCPALPLFLSYSSPTLIPSILGPVALVNSTCTKFHFLRITQERTFRLCSGVHPLKHRNAGCTTGGPPSRQMRVDRAAGLIRPRRSTRKTSDKLPVTACNPTLVAAFLNPHSDPGPASMPLIPLCRIIGSRFDSGTGLRYGAVE